MVFLLRDLGLTITNKDIEQELELDDDSMPMYYLCPKARLKLKAVGPTLYVASENSFGEIGVHKISRKATVSHLKEDYKEYWSGSH